MKIDAHYYAVLAFCLACGFDKGSAATIAYASQFVDDAKINHIIIAGSIPENVQQYDMINDQPSFFNMATCHSYTRIKTFNYSAMINNTSAFHFVPGCKGACFVRKMRCVERGQIIEQILEEALVEDNLVKLGLVLHVYADTFSHQGFSGLLSKVNDIEQLSILEGSGILMDKFKYHLKWLKDAVYKHFDRLMPAYGHGQASVYPDLPYLKWCYDYDFSDEFSRNLKSSPNISNPLRFTWAFIYMTKHLADYLRRHPQYRKTSPDPDCMDVLFQALLIKKTDKKRVRNWQKTLVDQGLLNPSDREAIEYDEYRWLKEAFENFDPKKFSQREVPDARLKQDFSTSAWYQYYLAVKWYKERLFHHCDQMGLKIPQ